MLWTPLNNFGWQVDNFGTTYTDAGFGTSVTASSNVNVKGTPVSLIAGASVTQDVYGIGIMGVGGNATGTIIRLLGDLLIDPSGGTTWSVAIANLLFNSPSLVMGGYNYHFPLYLKNGTSIGFRTQSNVASQVMRVGIRLYGKPTREELVKAGSKVETFGAVTASTSGTTITPGTGAMGSWTASLGTTSNDLWWWQSGGIATHDTTITLKGGLIEVGIGDATNKVVVATMQYMMNASEQVGMGAIGLFPPFSFQKAGRSVYSRAGATVAPDTTCSTIVYGLGG